MSRSETGPTSAEWPSAPAPAAWHGPAGAFVAAIDPHTEADPVALLIQFLVAFGSIVGRHAYFAVEASRHYPNEFAVLVGPSAKGRKGSAWDHVERLFATLEPSWAQGAVVSGLASGEGLIWAVRDPDDDGSGAQDKRLLVLEAEFASVMKILTRDANTLSPVVRNAWDGKDLQTMAKHAPARASGAHVSIIGHVTRDELCRYLDATELANGFFNRFVLVAVRRSKLLPLGGAVPPDALEPVTEQLRAALAFGRTERTVGFGASAEASWCRIYPSLSAEAPGMFGALTARAEAHVCRLALLYALLDCSQTIEPAHLDAALALWSYAENSARWIFGDALGDPTADEIFAQVTGHSDGMSRTEIRDVFSRNKRAKEIDRALGLLERAGRLERIKGTAGSGRPIEVWRPRSVPAVSPLSVSSDPLASGSASPATEGRFGRMA